MALQITSLNTGSNGNCFYIGNADEAILIDAGLTCKETELRMQSLKLSLTNVKAIFISHEHRDHIKGLPVISKKYNIPVYITQNTLKSGKQILTPHLINPFYAFEPITIGRLQITAFPKHHDAAEPHSFVVSCSEINVGVFTDIGTHCDNLVNHFKMCHAAFLETNYDPEMLMKGSYPYFLKQRIIGGKGHLSNQQALDLFITHKPEQMTHLFLSHLSKDNNDPDLVYNLFEAKATGVKIVVAPRTAATEVYHITGS